MTDALDTHASAIVTDHPFEPRTEAVLRVPDGAYETLDELPDAVRRLPPNPFLCPVCRLAQAAHLDVTVPYVSDAPRAEKPVCSTCRGEGRIDLNAEWHGPPHVERHVWSPCPDCDTPVRARW